MENGSLTVRSERHPGLVAVVAHDLRQPVSAALMAAEFVEDNLDDAAAAPMVRKHIALAKRCMRETLRLAADLLAMEQAAAGVLQLRRAPVDVALLLDDACALVAPHARSKHIDVRVDAPQTLGVLPRPMADRDRLLQVLMNVCGNAVKFTGGRGCVTLAAAYERGAVRITVSDTGPGVADDELPHVFDQYWQGRESAAHVGAAHVGAGLGLAIAKWLVEAHGGWIGAEAARGGGLTIAFTIPLVAACAPSAA